MQRITQTQKGGIGMRMALFGAIVAVGIALAGVFIASTLVSAPQAGESGKVSVAATIFPVHDIVRKVGGAHVNAHLILPPGASPHTFRPSPSQVRALQDVRTVFTIGGIDGWVTPLVANLPDARMVPVHEGIERIRFTTPHAHEHEEERDAEAHEEGPHAPEERELDPHYWLDARNAAMMARNVADTLIEMDPAHADAYRANRDRFVERMDTLHTEIRTTLSGHAPSEIITFHNSWQYFARAYGLEVAGTFEPSPGRGLTPQQLQNIEAVVREHNVNAAFAEPQLPTDAIQPLVTDLGLTLSVLDPLGGVEGRDSYEALMRYNMRTIDTALSQ